MFFQSVSFCSLKKERLKKFKIYRKCGISRNNSLRYIERIHSHNSSRKHIQVGKYFSQTVNFLSIDDKRFNIMLKPKKWAIRTFPPPPQVMRLYPNPLKLFCFIIMKINNPQRGILSFRHAGSGFTSIRLIPEKKITSLAFFKSCQILKRNS